MASDASQQTTRSCGGCTACCVWLPIPPGIVGPGAKPAGVACPEVCPTGCRSYSQRPACCRDFRCTWLQQGDWPDAWRPDRVGLLCLREKLDERIVGALVYEIAAEALQSPEAAAVLEALRVSSDLLVIVNAAGQRRLIRRDQPSGAQTPVGRPHFRIPNAAPRASSAGTPSAKQRQ